MATSKDAVGFLLLKLGNTPRIEARPMFGEYGLYADGRFVGAVCDDQLFVKILPASASLEGRCEKDTPYPGARPHYLVEESQWTTLTDLPEILFALAASIPEKRATRKRSPRK